MTLFRVSATALDRVTTTTFAAASLRERGDLQRLIKQHIDVLGEDLLVVAEEYALFQDARRRVDLLAVDRTGTLVVIELKRTEDGGHMELQALRYAAMVSTMTFEQLIDAHSHYNGIDATAARAQLAAWMDESVTPEQLSDNVRIILASADFSTEITSTVLWLNQQYGTDISCWRLVPYTLDQQVLLDIQQIIPLPEATDFQVQQRRKGASTAAARAAEDGRDFTKYDVSRNGEWQTRLSKQGAVKEVLGALRDVGVSPREIREAFLPRRWQPVRVAPGEQTEPAFRRQYPERGSHYWFDLDLVDQEGVSWVPPRIGGRHTEAALDAYTKLAPDGLRLEWQRSEESA